VGEGTFVNEPVDVSEIPRLDEESFSPMHPNFLRVSLIGSAIFAMATVVVGTTVALVVPSRPWIPILVMAVMLSLTAVTAGLKVLEVRNIGYLLRDHDLSYRSGVLVKTVETVPFVRVQHARISQGPIERSFGLATLEVNSAGPDLHIHGLPADDAERLKIVVVERAGDLAEEL
jgi:membrane protein YdbS with pleckstrin-like domain